MVGVVKIMVTSFKKSHAALLHSVPPTLQRTTAYPCLCWRLLDTHGHSVDTQICVSLLWGHCSFLLSLSVQKVCLCPPRVCFPVLCKFWWLYGGVNGYLLQEGLCHTQVCCIQSPCPCGRPLLTHTSAGDTQTQFWLSFCGLGMHFMPFPGLSISGNQVLGERTVPGGCVS